MKEKQLKGWGGPSAVFFWVFLGQSRTLLREVLPADNDSSLLLSWSCLPGRSGDKVLHYVLEWAGVDVVEPQWKQLASHQNCTSITGTEHLQSRQRCRLSAWMNNYAHHLILLYFLGGGTYKQSILQTTDIWQPHLIIPFLIICVGVYRFDFKDFRSLNTLSS